jgi:deazaflavin-dependent oxidoreductase (nitroreductase family)
VIRRVVVPLGVVVAAVCAFMGLVVVAMWTKSPRLLGAVRVFNRTVTNRLQRPFAGKEGAYASVVRHRGRRSGLLYETPIVPFDVDGGFLVSLPYGPTADWVQNVLTAGSAELVHGGRTLAVERPEVLTVAEVEHLFPPGEQRTHRLFRVEHCLRLRVVGAA